MVGMTLPVCFNGAAAFQPRNLAEKITASGVVLASMGPRHFSRGIEDYGDIFTLLYKLQWGRGISAAESVLSDASQKADTSFNGAAAFQPRNRHSRQCG